MITEIEHKKIYEIVEEFDTTNNKERLRTSIIALLNYKESKLKNQFKKLTFEFNEQIKEL